MSLTLRPFQCHDTLSFTAFLQGFRILVNDEKTRSFVSIALANGAPQVPPHYPVTSALKTDASPHRSRRRGPSTRGSTDVLQRRPLPIPPPHLSRTQSLISPSRGLPATSAQRRRSSATFPTPPLCVAKRWQDGPSVTFNAMEVRCKIGNKLFAYPLKGF